MPAALLDSCANMLGSARALVMTPVLVRMVVVRAP